MDVNIILSMFGAAALWRMFTSLLIYMVLYPIRFAVSRSLERWIELKRRPMIIKGLVGILLAVTRTRIQRRDAWMRKKVRKHFHIEDRLMGG